MRKPIDPAVWLARACAVWLIGLGAYFMVVRPALLPEDIRFLGATKQQIDTTLPGLASWLAHVFTVMGGFMAGAGVLAAMSAEEIARSRRSAGVFAIAGMATVGVMSAVNFSLGSDFRWLLVVPVLLWVAAVASALARREQQA